MLRNTRRGITETTTVKLSAANLSEFERAVHFIRLGAIDVCKQAPYHADFDTWLHNDQFNYESGRQNTGNLLAALKEEFREQARKEIIISWPETLRRIPPLVEKALNIANAQTGSAYVEKKTVQPFDPDVRASVLRDARGRMKLKVPTVCDN